MILFYSKLLKVFPRKVTNFICRKIVTICILNQVFPTLETVRNFSSRKLWINNFPEEATITFLEFGVYGTAYHSNLSLNKKSRIFVFWFR